jgi:hypothetical protein
MILFALWLMGWLWFRTATSQDGVVYTVRLHIDSSYAVVGPPTISAAFINQVLAAYHSPAAGKGQALYDLGVTYGIDPVYALAFFWHESGFGTAGEARVTRSLGNERCITDRPCIDQNRGGYALMQSWEDGFDHWYHLILYGYVRGAVTVPLVGHTCVTVDQIVPVYAPSGDGNDVAAYSAAVKHAVNTWRRGQVWV